MNFNKILILSLFIFLASTIHGQEIEKDYRALEKVSEYQLILNNDSIKPFYLSANPITNREYLIYLCWIANVYRDFPRVFLEAFPLLGNNYVDSIESAGFTPIQIRTLVNSNPITKRYMFNPEFIDYPVIGITWKQSMIFLNWLSDRYNESLLIGWGILQIDHDQRRQSSFNTESYLFGQYVGLINKPLADPDFDKGRGAIWEDRIMVPSFRLPGMNEIALVKNGINTSLIPYKPNKFLKYWNKYYLSSTKELITLKIGFNDYFSFSPNVTPFSHNYDTYELALDCKTSKSQNSIIEIFSGLNQNIIEIQDDQSTIHKNSLGQMPFLIISEDKNLQPIIIERTNYSDVNADSCNHEKKYSIFRYALSGIKK